MKLRLFILFVTVWLTLPAQVSLNLTQIAWINQHILSNTTYPALITVTSPEVSAWLSQQKIFYRKINARTFFIQATAKQFQLLAQQPNISRLYLETGRPQPLNDTAVIHNNVLPIHNGNGFITPFKGKNVVLGFIDTGIDIQHPDFKDSLGNTRIYRIWDQNASYDGNHYGFGKIWTNQDIDNGICTHRDPFSYYGHGSQVSGSAAGNGRAVNNFTGMAPESKIIMVASKFDTINWLATVVQSIDYIFSVADSLQMPCVINISAGDYYGSHDGLDLPSQLIDSMLRAKNGRAIVCAVGNAGFYPFHIQHLVNNDTTFTWFQYNSNTMLGYGAFFTEAWGDSSYTQNLTFAVQMHHPTGYQQRGSTAFYTVYDCLNNTITDTIVNANGNILAIIDFFASYDNGSFRIQFHSQQPDSSNYYFSVKTAGTGKLDFWSAAWLGTSEPVSSIPSAGTYPPIAKYALPNTFQTMVSSFTCLPSVITVGNFVNRKKYLDIDSVWQTMSTTVGEIGYTSSLGPTRTGIIKPDLTATGDVTLSACPDTVIQVSLLNGQNNRIALGGKHKRNGGSSLASPVVAGITALLFEKCPNMDFSTLKNILLNTTKTDAFTGNTPNDRWGYGKVDGWNALSTTNFQVSLFGNSSVCAGDSISLATAAYYNTYQWNTGNTGNSIWVTDSGSYWVTVSNQYGCQAISDTLTITLYPSPAKPGILAIDGTLITDAMGYSQYIWHNINSHTDYLTSNNVFSSSDSGFYYVTVIDSNGCSAHSDTVYFASVGMQDYHQTADVNLFPNPAQNQIQVSSHHYTIKTVSLFSVEGKKIKTFMVNRKQLSINLSRLPEGTYFIRLSLNNQQTITRKFIKLTR